MLYHKLRQECAVGTPRHVVSSGNRKKSPGVVVEARRIVETCSLRYEFAKAHDPPGAVVEPPGRPQEQARIVTCQRRQLAAIRRFVQSEQNDRQFGLISKLIQ